MENILKFTWIEKNNAIKLKVFFCREERVDWEEVSEVWKIAAVFVRGRDAI